MLKKYSAKDIYKRVAFTCKDKWSEKKIKEYLKKNGENKVDALWIAKRKDVQRRDKLWLLLLDFNWANPKGLAPEHVRDKVIDFIHDMLEHSFSFWYAVIYCNPNRAKRAMRLLVKLLEEEK